MKAKSYLRDPKPRINELILMVGENGDYLGCLEVTQDITDIGKIEGEKRLL